MHPFRAAVEAGDHDALEALLAEDVVFTSPVVFKPYPGKAITAAILRGAGRVFEDLRYVREINGADDRDHAFVFKATVDGREVHGCDFLHFDEDGLIDEFTVMVRPLSGAQALAAAMGAQFERITAEALEAAAAEAVAPHAPGAAATTDTADTAGA
ncbi:nuclear transport factor 2 family protein [Streptacidiphilus jiangxiensis]|uniref:SnoaL-like domain-containing protein n=1 Tax=Streptacidiphilus jiangxiensis TaxID=235985 RepID=A0A1H7Z5E1_STRJI|nr:nuclear transport factor 2 family protein [Streptacidiphilus jiangxiensis]SEM52758.1 SnoaL-like domain-containing protein [Streptacidiphilus jiangxiensis]